MRRERLFLEDIVAAANAIAEFIVEVWRAAARDVAILRDQIAEILQTEFPK